MHEKKAAKRVTSNIIEYRDYYDPNFGVGVGATAWQATVFLFTQTLVFKFLSKTVFSVTFERIWVQIVVIFSYLCCVRMRTIAAHVLLTTIRV